MNRTDELLKSVAECILDEEESFLVIVNADMLDIPLEGAQRLVMGGKATPYLNMSDEGIEAGLSINRFHYDVFIPWEAISGVEGQKKAFYCEREDVEGKGKKSEAKTRNGHLRLVND